MKRLFLASKCSIPEIADRKRRFFRSSCHSEGLNAPKRCPERSEGMPPFLSPWGEAEGSLLEILPLRLRSGSEWQKRRSGAVLSQSPEIMRRGSEGMTKSPEKRFLMAILGLSLKLLIEKVFL